MGTCGQKHPSYTQILTSNSKFFGKPNGAKPAAPQQSKLAFSTKSAAKKDETVKENEPTSSSEEVKKETSVAAEDEAMPDASDREKAAPVKRNGSAQPKKRAVEEDEDSESANEHSEPPSKKPKTRPANGKYLTHVLGIGE